MNIIENNLNIRILVRRLWIHFCSDSLFRNSVYLMMSTGVMAGFGFIFWIITTHFYTSEQIGFATALISATVLISNFSLLGFNASLIRYLPQAKRPNVMINTAMSIVAVATIILSVGYLVSVNYLSPQFHLLASTPSYAIYFVVFMITVSLNTLTDSVFIAYRFSKYNLIVYTFFGLTKIILPIFLISFGSYGIFFAYTGSVIVSLGLSIYFMKKNFGYQAMLITDKESARKMATFSTVNYLAAFMSGFPTLIMPTIIVSKLGASQSAYFYMASAIAALLYVVPQAITQSLFAEGSHSKEELIMFTKKAARLIGLLLIPGIIAFLLFGNFVLLIFGKEYSTNSYHLLQIMSLTGIFLSVNLVGATIMKVQNRMKALFIVNMGYLIVTLLLIYWWIQYGTVGICWALFGGQIFISLGYIFLFFINRRQLVNSF